MSAVSSVPLGELMATKTGSVDPAKFADEVFDLYSIPAFDKGQPEVVAGSSIGSAKQVIKPGDVLLSKIVPHIRRSWVVGNDRGRRLIASGEWIVFRSDRIDTAYLRHVLMGNPFHAQFMQTVSGVGGSLLRARPTQVAKICVPLPPLPEQRRIAAILDQADALRAKRREALAQLDSLTQSIFIEMFGDPVAGVPKSILHPLESLLEEPFQNGAYFQKESYCEEGGVEMVHMSDAFDGIVMRGKLKRVSCDADDIQKYSLNTDDILIARRSLTYEGAAKPCMIPFSEELLIFESSFIRIKPNKTLITPLFLFHYLNNELVRQKYVRPYVTQSTISGINQSNLAKVPVMRPPLNQQHAFGTRITVIEKLKQMYNYSLSELNTLFASLQHRAFRGEL